MTLADAQLTDAVAAARAFLETRLRPDWNTVAAVVVTRSGSRHMAMNLDSTTPRASICAEPIALGMAFAEDPDAEIVLVAAVNRHGAVIPPCGACRELMLDYAATARVAIPGDGGDSVAVPLGDLVPSAYKANRRRGS